MGSDIHTYAIRNPALKFLTRHVLRHADVTAAVSQDLAKRMNRLAPGLSGVHVIPNGIDIEAFRPGNRHHAREELGLAKESTYLLFVGGLIPVKGIAHLQEALSPLLRERPGLRLLVAGEGPLRTELESWAGRTAPGRVHLLGGVPHENMPTLYRAADGFLLPSQNEGPSQRASGSHGLRPSLRRFHCGRHTEGDSSRTKWIVVPGGGTGSNCDNRS